MSQDDLQSRLAALAALAATIRRRADELTDAALATFGFPRSMLRADIELAAHRLDAFGELAAALGDARPVGTVALCLPGNAVLSNPVATIGSSYLAGNRTLARFPRRRAGWATLVLELLAGALGDGIEVSHDQGARFVGAMLADESVPVLMVFGDDAWMVDYAGTARRSGTKVIFEGPGKDPFLLLDPALAAAAATAAVRAGCFNAGRACTAPERIYALRPAYDEFVDALVAAAEAVPTGLPDDPATEVGPLDPAGAARISGQLDAAVAAGAKVLTGGTGRPVRVGGRPGVIIPPTVVVDVDQGMDLLRAETFGPVLPVLPVDSPEQAVELAEDSPYGLSATVFGGPAWVPDRLVRTHGAVHLGETWLDQRQRDPVAAYGGRRRSGWVWEWQGDQFVQRDGPRRNAIEFSRWPRRRPAHQST
ncbi:MAG: betaine-aldehyde dehydrogenase [Mycobacteriales bacterium]